MIRVLGVSTALAIGAVLVLLIFQWLMPKVDVWLETIDGIIYVPQEWIEQ